MKASTLDLRRRTAEIIAALERGERIHLSYRGRETAVITPVGKAARTAVRSHPFFGADRSRESVEAHMNRLRAPRHNAV